MINQACANPTQFEHSRLSLYQTHTHFLSFELQLFEHNKLGVVPEG